MAAPPPSPRVSMLPPNACTIFLCTPPAPPYQCTFYALTRDETLAHLLNSHAEVPSYVAAYGTLGLRSLPVKAILHAATPHDNAHEHEHEHEHADALFVCFCCRMYFALESSLHRHIAQNGLAGPIVDLVGEEGLRTWVRGNCRRRIVVAPGQGAPAPVGDAMEMLMRRLVRPGIPIPVANRIEASPARAQAVQDVLPVVNQMNASPARPRTPLPVSPAVPHIQDSPVHVHSPAPPANGLPMRLFFTWPLTPAHPLITLAAPRTAQLMALVAAEYAAVDDGAVDWVARLRKGIVVRYDRALGAPAAARVVRCDNDLEALWDEALWAEAFVGDRRVGR